jgi:hypothetical protein
MLSRFMLRIQHASEKQITVKGVAEKLVTSDLAAFTCSVTSKGQNRIAGYKALEQDKKNLLAKLDSLGFTAQMREDENISCDAHYRTVKTKDAKGKETTNTIFSHYELVYSLRVRTGNVQLVSRNLLKIHELAAQGMNVSVGNPQYFINNPEQYKLELVNAASASAAQEPTPPIPHISTWALARRAAASSPSNIRTRTSAREFILLLFRAAIFSLPARWRSFS